MEEQTTETPEAHSEIKKAAKKGGWLVGVLSKLGLGSAGSVVGAGGIGASGAGASGLFGGLLGGGLMATKAGMLALAIVGTTVAGVIGLIGYKMFVNPNSSGKSGVSSKDQFNSFFASRPREAAGSDQNSSASSGKNGSSSSLDFLVQGNPGAEEAKEEAVQAEVKSESADGAAAPVNPAAALDNANAPSAGQAASFHNKDFKSDKKFGALSGALAGGGSGASFAAAMKGAPEASNPLLAGGRMGQSSAMKGQGRAATGGRRVDAKRDSKSGRQLANLDRMSKSLGSRNAGNMTFDGGTPGSPIGPADEITGAPASGQSGMPDRSVNPTPNSERGLNEPVTPAYRDVTPWSKDLAKAKTMTWIAILTLFAAIMALQHYYSEWVSDYNTYWQTNNLKAFIGTKVECGGILDTTLTAVYNPLVGAALLVKAKAAMTPILEGAVAKQAGLLSDAIAHQAVLKARGAALKGASSASPAGPGLKAAEVQVELAKTETEINGIRAALKIAVASAYKAGQVAALAAGTPACAAQATKSAILAGFDMAACEAAVKASVPGIFAGYQGCMTTGQVTGDAAAVATASAAAQASAGIWQVAGGVLLAAAMATSLMVIDAGSKLQKGQYKQEAAGKALVLGGGLVAAMTAIMVFGGYVTTPVVTTSMDGALSGKLTGESAKLMTSIGSMPIMLKVAGVAALTMGAAAAMKKGETVKCKTDMECKNIEEKGHAYNYRQGTPSDHALDKFLT